MSYRVTSPGWSGGNGLVSTTPVVVLTLAAMTQIAQQFQVPFNLPGVFATVNGSAFTFYIGSTAHPLGTVTLSTDTLASTFVGQLILIQTGIPTAGAWVQGQVISDGISLLIGSTSVPLTARASGAVIGYQGDTGPFAIEGVSGDGTRTYFSRTTASGGAAAPTAAPTFYGSALTTLGTLSPGAVAAVEMVAGSGSFTVVTI